MRKFWFVMVSCLLLAGCGNDTEDQAKEQGDQNNQQQTTENAKNDQSKDNEEKQTDEGSSESVDKENTFNWKTYQNERFGFTIKYPEEWTPAPEPTNGDGRALVSGNENEVLVYASNYMPENHPDLIGYEKVTTAEGYEAYIMDDQDSRYEGIIIHDDIEFHLSASISQDFKNKYYEAIKQMFLNVKFE